MENQDRNTNKFSPKSEFGFIIMHLLPLGALFTGVTAFDWILCVLLYFVRMFFVTGAYHRYFSHRTYKTSRAFQFFLAFMAQTSVQKGALWWAAHHRVHHRTSDSLEDPHSMKHYGFWYSHIGWIMTPDFKVTEMNTIQDFSKYPELRWLNKFHIVPGLVMMVACLFLGAYINSPEGGFLVGNGLSTVFIGFFLSTVLLYHGTFSINSIMHKFGKKRYDTGDESKNSLWLALVTLGEGWHNNHHYYQSSTRQGFFWYEIDITYYILKTFSWFGLVWDLNEVPDEVKYSKNMNEAMAKLKAKNKAAA